MHIRPRPCTNFCPGHTIHEVGMPASPTPYGADPAQLPQLSAYELVSADGSCYKGEWKGGKKHGRGIYMWPDGSMYEGEWEEDRFHGYGKLCYVYVRRNRNTPVGRRSAVRAEHTIYRTHGIQFTQRYFMHAVRICDILSLPLHFLCHRFGSCRRSVHMVFIH